MTDKLEVGEAAARAPRLDPPAGDLLIAAVDTWAEHGPKCDVDPCPKCDALFNQVRLAHKVWQNSSHQPAARAPREPLERITFSNRTVVGHAQPMASGAPAWMASLGGACENERRSASSLEADRADLREGRRDDSADDAAHDPNTGAREARIHTEEEQAAAAVTVAAARSALPPLQSTEEKEDARVEPSSLSVAPIGSTASEATRLITRCRAD
jgi:hypothetical protein